MMSLGLTDYLISILAWNRDTSPQQCYSQDFAKCKCCDLEDLRPISKLFDDSGKFSAGEPDTQQSSSRYNSREKGRLPFCLALGCNPYLADAASAKTYVLTITIDLRTWAGFKYNDASVMEMIAGEAHIQKQTMTCGTLPYHDSHLMCDLCTFS